jgi:hypothetical protein
MTRIWIEELVSAVALTLFVACMALWIAIITGAI